MQTYKKISCLSIILLMASLCAAQSTTPRPSSRPDEIPLAIKPGVPIRVALIKSVRIRHVGTQVEGRLVQPLYVFDREVIPANSTLLGSVTEIEPVSRKKRMMALANGNLTPFHEAHVEFTTLVLKNGRQFSIQTDVSPGTTDVISLVAGGGNKDTGRVHGTIGQVRRQIAQSEHQAIATLKAPHKLKRAEAIFSAQLPFHRQVLPAGTEFTATLKNPLKLGTEDVSQQELEKLGSEIPSGSTVHVWLATPLSSAKDHKGSLVEAIVSQPLFSKNHHLILPEGSRLEGVVTQSVPARRLSRNGKLRFTFQRIKLPDGLTRTVEAGLQAASVGKATHMEIDSEGGAHTVSPKTKYIMPAIDVLLATSSFDGDSEERLAQEHGTFQPGDLAGGGVRGGIGFGLMGSAIAMAARAQPLTAAFAFYGAAMSVYSHIVARGNDVIFPKETDMEIRFGTHESQQRASHKNRAVPTGKSPASHTT